MHRPPAVLTLVVALSTPLGLSACDSDGGGAERAYAHETGAPCTRETVDANCEQAESLAVRLEGLDGVARVEFEFRTIDGEGVNELIFVIAAAEDAAAAEVAEVISVGSAEMPTIDGDRDLTLTVTRSGAGLHLDPDEETDAVEAAGILVAAGSLSAYGRVDTSLSPAEIWVSLPSGRTYRDIGPVADAVAALDLAPTVDVVISSGGSYLSRHGLDEQDAGWWERLVAATAVANGFEVVAFGIDGNDIDVTVEVPGATRRDLTFAAYGDRLWPMVTAHLDLARERGRGETYSIDTNWPQEDDGFDTFLTAVVGPRDGGRDPRGWNAAAEAYLDR